MAENPTATISVNTDWSGSERAAIEHITKVQRLFSRAFLSGNSISRPLGEISGKADEFGKSMAAANARVLAFGASAGVIYAVSRAFDSMVKATIGVNKALVGINVFL